MNKILLSLFLFLTIDGVCQKGFESNSIARFFKLYPQEQAFLITDNSTYVNGESIWYKLYLWNGIDEQLSEDVLVLLRDAAANIIEEQRVIVSEGEVQGDFQIAEALKAGTYRVDVVTDWSFNFQNSPIATRIISVVGKSEGECPIEDKMIILAEGGGFVVGNENRIGFYPGCFSSKPFTIDLTAPSGERILHKRVDTLYTVEKVLIREPGEYSATLCIEGGKCATKKIKTSNQTLSVLSRADDKIRVNVPGPAKSSLVVCSASRVIDYLKVEKGGEIELSIDEYPAGLYYVLMVDEQEHMIMSSLTFFKRPEEIPFQFTMTPRDSSGDLFVSTTISVISQERFSIHAVITPTDAVSGHFMLSDLSSDELNELLLFEQFPLSNVVSDFLNQKKINIKRKLPQLSTLAAPITPLSVVLGEVHKKSRIDSVVQLKKTFNRIRNDYQPSNVLQYALPRTDESYVPSEYTSISSATEFLDHVIPRLKKLNTMSSEPYRFFYTNLKDRKQLYEEPPALIVNGLKISSFSALDAFRFDQIKAIHTLYNSRTLVETNLQKLFPGGAIFVEVDEGPQPSQLKDFTRFSGQYSWPHRYEPFNSKSSTHRNRIPALNHLYYWTNYGHSTKKQLNFTVDLPTIQLQQTLLSAFSLQSVRQGTYSKVMLNGKL